MAGAWPGEYVGTLGQMEYTNGGIAACHICGQGFENLSVHVYSHGTWPDEYRAYFGLKRRQSLLSRGMRERWSKRSSAPTVVEALSRARAARGDWRTLMKGRRGPARLQARIEIAAALAAPRLARRKVKACRNCGKQIPWRPKLYRKTCSDRCASELITKARRSRPPVNRPCRVCGNPVTRRFPSRGAPKTCSDACAKKAISRANRKVAT